MAALADQTLLIADARARFAWEIAQYLRVEDARLALSTSMTSVDIRRVAQDLDAAVAVADVSTRDGATQMVGEIERARGMVNVLVYVPAGPLPASFSDRPVAEWYGDVQGALRSCFHVVQSVIEPMRRARQGAIVLVGSECEPDLTLSSRRISVGRHTVDAGLVGLGKTLARELAAEGIRVNMVMPIDKRGASFATDADGRTSVEAIAQTVAFLASERGSAFVGQVLTPGSQR